MLSRNDEPAVDSAAKSAAPISDKPKSWPESIHSVLVEQFVRWGFPREHGRSGELDAESMYRLVRDAAMLSISGGLASLLDRLSASLNGTGLGIYTLVLAMLLAILSDFLRRWRTDYSQSVGKGD